MHKNKATRIIDQMMANDRFSQWLGIERLAEREGYCELRLKLREEMCNGFGIIHGGITYSLADSALAFASNSHGKHAVSIEVSISHIKALHPGDVIIAVAEEKGHSNKLAIYEVIVRTADGELIAVFKGMVYRKEKDWTLD
ncbi:MAG TPA: hotdog fold thioesterase [Chitinophagaceae bacterium]